MNQKFDTYSDNELFSMLTSRGHREQAFKELYRRFEQRVWAYSRISLRNDEQAKDVVQDAFMRFYKAGEHGAVVVNIAAYLMRIVRNLVIDAQHKTSQQFVNIDDLEISIPMEEDNQKELEQVIETALQLLPEEYRDALIMQTYSNMTYNEIAIVQEVPVTTVRNRIVRAKSRLRELLSGYVNSGE